MLNFAHVQTAQAVDLDVYVEPMPIAGVASTKVQTKKAEVAVDEAAPAEPEKKVEKRGSDKGKRAHVKISPPDDDAPPAMQVEEPLGEEEITDIAPGEPEKATRSRTIRVKVGGAPLLIRAREDLDSPIIGQLHPGQMVTVIQEKVTKGKVRAMIALESISRLPEAVLKSEASERFAALAASAESLAGTESALSPRASPVGGVQSAELDALASGRAATSDAASGQLETMTTEPVSHEEIAEKVAKGGIDGLAGKIGWVTLMKDGKKLVTSRVRQSAGSRQQHLQQWVRRTANDQLQKVSGGHKLGTVALELSSDPSGLGFAFGGIHPGESEGTHLYPATPDCNP